MSFLQKIRFLLSVACLLCIIPFSSHATEFTVNKIAAVVNGEMITLHDLRGQTLAELHKQNISNTDPRADSIMRQVLESKINDLLISQEAVRYKVSIPDSEVENELNRIAKANNVTLKQFEAQLVKQGTSFDTAKEQVRSRMLRQRMMTFMVARKVVVTQDEISDFYAKNKSQFVSGKDVDFSVLVFAANANVKNIYKQIESGTMSFEQAAQKYSHDATAKNGGRVGKRAWDSLPASFQSLLSTLSLGKISPIISVEGNPAIVKLNTMSEGKQESLEEATPKIERVLREPKLQSRFNDYMLQLRNKAVVDIRL